MNAIQKIGLIVIMMVFVKPLQAQQDPQYSLYQFNQMAINPAYAGARDAIAVVMDMRKQWVSFPGAPTTLDFTIHSPVWNNKLGVGLNAISDQIGAKSTSGVYGNISYILKLNNKFKLSFGIRAGYLNYKFNFNKVNYKDVNEGSLADLSNVNRSALDIDAGLYLRSNTFYLGISSTHISGESIFDKDYSVINNLTGQSQNVTSSYVMSRHLFIISGKAFSINENLVFSPSVMVKYVSTKVSADLNLNFLINKRLWLGAFVSQGSGAGLLFQVYATEKLRIGYAYNASLGSKRILGSSHEVMIGFDFGNYKTKTVSPRFL